MAQLHGSHDDTCAERGLAAVEVDGERAAAHAVGELLHERLAQVHRDVAHIPLALSLVGDVFGHLQAQGGLVQGGVDGVGQIAGVAGLIEIVSVVAEEG